MHSQSQLTMAYTFNQHVCPMQVDLACHHSACAQLHTTSHPAHTRTLTHPALTYRAHVHMAHTGGPCVPQRRRLAGPGLPC